MTKVSVRMPAERRLELEKLAHQIASQVAWGMALEDQALTDEGVQEIENETLAELLASD